MLLSLSYLNDNLRRYSSMTEWLGHCTCDLEDWGWKCCSGSLLELSLGSPKFNSLIMLEMASLFFPTPSWDSLSHLFHHSWTTPYGDRILNDYQKKWNTEGMREEGAFWNFQMQGGYGYFLEKLIGFSVRLASWILFNGLCFACFGTRPIYVCITFN